MNNPLITAILLIAAVFGLLTAVAHKVPFGEFIVGGLGIALLGACAVIYIVRHHTDLARRLHAVPGVGQFMNLVCSLAKEQPIVGTARATSGGGPSGGRSTVGSTTSEAGRPPQDGITPVTAGDFRAVAEGLRASVFGHDSPIDRIVEVVERGVILRRRREAGQPGPPLAVFVVAGPHGIGKRFLSRRLAQHLFARPSVLELQGGDLSDSGAAASVFGAAGQKGAIVSAVRSCPHQVVFVEDFERVSAKALLALRDALRAGQVADEEGRPVGFQDVVVFLATSRGLDSLRAVESRSLVGESRVSAWSDVLTMDGSVPPSLLNVVNDFVLLDAPSALDRARVVLGLMQEICEEQGVTLEHVEAEVVAEEVLAMPEVGTFEACRERLRRRLAPDLADLARRGRRKLIVSTETGQGLQGGVAWTTSRG